MCPLHTKSLAPSHSSQNLEQGSLVNGSVGIVQSFMSSKAAIKAGISIARIDSGGSNHYQPARELDVEEGPDDPSSQGRVWPVVRFTNGRELLCIPLDFTVNNSMGIMEAQRDQVGISKNTFCFADHTQPSADSTHTCLGSIQ